MEANNKDLKEETNKNSGIVTAVILLGFLMFSGIFGLVNTLFLEQNMLDEFAKNAVETTAVIDRYYDKSTYEYTPVYDRYRVFVKYTTRDGEEYKEYTAVDEEPNIGDVITIYYNKNNPSEIRTTLVHSNSHKLIDIGMSILCFGLVCTALICAYHQHRKKKNNKKER